MLHMYLLVSLFSVFSMEPMNILDIQHQINVEMKFASNPHLHIGDPVLYKGAVVGSVSKVQQISDSSDSSVARVSIRLSSGAVPLEQEVVGLVSSMKLSNSTGVSSRSFVDIMHLADKNSADKKPGRQNIRASEGNLNDNFGADFIRGFSSFQEFWSTTSL